MTHVNERETFDRDHEIRTDGQAHMGAVNIDAMNEDELVIATAHPALHVDVRMYAALALAARSRRLSGLIEQATRIEKRMEVQYKLIPASCKW